MAMHYTALPELREMLFSPLCQLCGRELSLYYELGCLSCLKSLCRNLGKSDSLFLYEAAALPLMQLLRNRAPFSTAGLVLRFLKRREFFAQWKALSFDLVLSAPQNRKAQVSGLALVVAGIAKELGLPSPPSYLQKKRIHAQHGKPARERLDVECFLEWRGPDSFLRGKKVLLVDDVCTTGTTLDLAEHLFYEAGAIEVVKFSLARKVMPSLDRDQQESHEEGQEVSPFLLHLFM